MATPFTNNRRRRTQVSLLDDDPRRRRRVAPPLLATTPPPLPVQPVLGPPMNIIPGQFPNNPVPLLPVAPLQPGVTTPPPAVPLTMDNKPVNPLAKIQAEDSILTPENVPAPSIIQTIGRSVASVGKAIAEPGVQQFLGQLGIAFSDPQGPGAVLGQAGIENAQARMASNLRTAQDKAGPGVEVDLRQPGIRGITPETVAAVRGESMERDVLQLRKELDASATERTRIAEEGANIRNERTIAAGDARNREDNASAEERAATQRAVSGLTAGMRAGMDATTLAQLYLRAYPDSTPEEAAQAGAELRASWERGQGRSDAALQLDVAKFRDLQQHRRHQEGIASRTLLRQLAADEAASRNMSTDPARYITGLDDATLNALTPYTRQLADMDEGERESAIADMPAPVQRLIPLIEGEVHRRRVDQVKTVFTTRLGANASPQEIEAFGQQLFNSGRYTESEVVEAIRQYRRSLGY